jgi:hypothetical protein
VKEHEFEPIRGLPEHLPPGEEMLWQGAPRWTTLARRAFHVWKVALYFAVIIVWRVFADLSAGETLAEVMTGALWVLALGLVAIGGLALLAWAMAKATVYTITSRRVVMRFGVALQMIVNFPYAQIASAQMRRNRDGTGDIPLLLTKPARASYMLQWPHVRPWHFSHPQPMLRAIPDVAKVAGILSNALSAFAAGSDVQPEEGSESSADGEAPEATPTS